MRTSLIFLVVPILLHCGEQEPAVDCTRSGLLGSDRLVANSMIPNTLDLYTYGLNPWHSGVEAQFRTGPSTTEILQRDQYCVVRREYRRPDTVSAGIITVRGKIDAGRQTSTIFTMPGTAPGLGPGGYSYVDQPRHDNILWTARTILSVTVAGDQFPGFSTSMSYPVIATGSFVTDSGSEALRLRPNEGIVFSQDGFGVESCTPFISIRIVQESELNSPNGYLIAECLYEYNAMRSYRITPEILGAFPRGSTVAMGTYGYNDKVVSVGNHSVLVRALNESYTYLVTLELQ